MLKFPEFRESEPEYIPVVYITHFGKFGDGLERTEREDLSDLTPYGVRQYLEELNSTSACELTLIKVDGIKMTEETVLTVEVSGLVYDEDGKCYLYDDKKDRFNEYGHMGERFLTSDINLFEDSKDGPRIIMHDEANIIFDDGAHFVKCGRGMFKLVGKLRWRTWLHQ